MATVKINLFKGGVVLGVLIAALNLVGVTDVSWWIITLPFWFVPAVVVAFVFSFLITIGLSIVINTVLE